MFFNPNMLAALALGFILFVFGIALGVRIRRPRARIIAGAIFLVLCAPGAMLIAYYFHLIREPLWYVDMRSAPGFELTAAMWGLFLGFVSAMRPFLFPKMRGVLRLHMAIIGALLVFIPFAKPVLMPVEVSTHFSDKWQDGVCMQSTHSTCGPASMATLYSLCGEKRSEKDIARAAFSSITGTEIWYLMRDARRHGLRAEYLWEPDLNRVPLPSMIGTRMGVKGHFITLLARQGNQYTFGDPMRGRFTATAEEFNNLYAFSGCVLHIAPVEQRTVTRSYAASQ